MSLLIHMSFYCSSRLQEQSLGLENGRAYNGPSMNVDVLFDGREMLRRDQPVKNILNGKKYKAMAKKDLALGWDFSRMAMPVFVPYDYNGKAIGSCIVRYIMQDNSGRYIAVLPVNPLLDVQEEPSVWFGLDAHDEALVYPELMFYYVGNDIKMMHDRTQGTAPAPMPMLTEPAPTAPIASRAREGMTTRNLLSRAAIGSRLPIGFNVAQSLMQAPDQSSATIMRSDGTVVHMSLEDIRNSQDQDVLQAISLLMRQLPELDKPMFLDRQLEMSPDD